MNSFNRAVELIPNTTCGNGRLLDDKPNLNPCFY